MRFDLKQVAVLISGREINEFADGADSLDVSPLADVGALTIGANGHGVFTKTNNNAVRLTMNLLQNSEDNEYLCELYNRQEKRFKNFKALELYIEDTLNGDVYTASEGYFTIRPSFTRGNQTNSSTWVIDFVNGETKLAKGAGY